jgi:hypothetical protein
VWIKLPSNIKPSAQGNLVAHSVWNFLVLSLKKIWGFFTSVFCLFEAGLTFESNNSIEQGGLDCGFDNSTT